MHAETYLKETAAICEHFVLNSQEIERMAVALSEVKGRVYMVGLGGSLANCMHMAADLSNLCGIDALAPNIAEMTAHMNDEGMEHAFKVNGTFAGSEDALFVLSVGGGTESVSTGITRRVKKAREGGAKIFGIVGPNGGITAELGDYVIKIPVSNPKHVTPHTEAFQAVIWHALICHPLLQKRPTKW